MIPPLVLLTGLSHLGAAGWVDFFDVWPLVNEGFIWLIYGLYMDDLWIWLIYPLVMTDIAIEHGPVETVSFPNSKKWRFKPESRKR